MIASLCPESYLKQNRQLVCARLARVQGSSPRDAGTFMLVSASNSWGSVGGGQLEFLVIEAAHQMLENGVIQKHLDVPLGPEINQCCGGRVEVELFQPDNQQRQNIVQHCKNNVSRLPHVYVFGAGHTGREICNLLQFMPVRAFLVDERADEHEKCSANVGRVQSMLPENTIRNAPNGSAAIILTHAHSLDFIIASEALKSEKFTYVGMIGSMTKRAKFMTWFVKENMPGERTKLVCPIGTSNVSDKRPAVIASFVVAEVMKNLSTVLPVQGFEAC